MKYSADILWERKPDELFTDGKYSRVHKWTFDGGTEVPASSSPQVVRLPLSSEAAVDPEEAFIASLSSCHMLFFLSIAAGKKYLVEKYKDHAEGVIGKDEDGELMIRQVTLQPRIVFGGQSVPSPEEIAEIHELSHKKCFIANSVKTKVEVVPEQQ